MSLFFGPFSFFCQQAENVKGRAYPQEHDNKRCVSGKDHRISLAKKMALPYSEDSVNRVHEHGPGSSFDGVKHDNQASRVKVFDRWKHYKDDSLYKSTFKDPELVDLSCNIFSHIPGTSSLTDRNG